MDRVIETPIALLVQYLNQSILNGSYLMSHTNKHRNVAHVDHDATYGHVDNDGHNDHVDSN